ncbi:MAG: L,D-transpeptidase [Lachnospiraceae bacterium]|nr:L,D-transpeptidase [Lachnospiraceae bacterium]
MKKYKTKISLLLVCLMCFVIINFNVKSYAQEFADISKLVYRTDNNVTTISEYDINDNTYIDINNISLETAIDSTCDTSEEVVEYVSSGSITEVITNNANNVTTYTPTGEIVESNTNNIYYLGETSSQENATFGSNNVVSTQTDAKADYYVENWMDIPGELSIRVNKQASCVTVYKGDTPIRAMACSAGESTPEGTFYMQSQWEWLSLIDNQYGRYCSQICGDFLFHSVPYNSMDIYDLDTEMYNQLGTLCSHGCVRLTIEDAKWIYDNCSTGVEITIFSDIVPGPLGKPVVDKIPVDQTWDPTDFEVQ